MRRRQFIVGCAIAALPFSARGQSAAVRRIGLLSPFTAADSAPWHRAFLRGLRDLGWLDGANITIDYRYADGQIDRLSGLIAELINLKVEIIVTSVTNDTLAAKNATADIPIVMVAPGDPVGTGIVESIARPGGNVTGLSQMVPDLNGKRLALIKELAPGVSALAVISNPEDPISRLGLDEVRAAATKLGIRVHAFEASNTEQLRGALDRSVGEHVQALAILPSPLFVTNLKPIADFALQNRLPAIFHLREFAQAGGLVSYGVDRLDLFRRAATYVDRILKGENPAVLPVEQPTKFDLVINNKTAAVLGLTIPSRLLYTADEIIE